MENQDGKQNLDHKRTFFFFFNWKREKYALEKDFVMLIPAVGTKIKRQTDFMTLLVLSVRDITVVCRLQHQHTPKKNIHGEHVNGFSPVNTKQNTQKHFRAMSQLVKLTLRPTAAEHRKGGRGNYLYFLTVVTSYTVKSGAIV